VSYAAEHASALADLKAAGVPMTFTRTTAGIGYNEATDTYVTPPVTITIAGYGILTMGGWQSTSGNIQNEPMTTVVETTPIAGFTPSTYPLKAFTAEFVLPNDTLEVNGDTFTVVKVMKVVAPDGNVIYSTISVTH
jgi:hypothetical protein